MLFLVSIFPKKLPHEEVLSSSRRCSNNYARKIQQRREEKINVQSKHKVTFKNSTFHDNRSMFFETFALLTSSKLLSLGIANFSIA